jgi:hypothetical protein
MTQQRQKQGERPVDGIAKRLAYHLKRIEIMKFFLTAIERNMKNRQAEESMLTSKEGTPLMSTYIHVVSNRHISAILGAYAREYVAHKRRVFTELHAKVLGETLLAANVACVELFYGSANTPCRDFVLTNEFYNPPGHMEALKLCACLETNCSLAPQWPESDAKRELDHMRAWFVEALAGYREAKWEIT